MAGKFVCTMRVMLVTFKGSDHLYELIEAGKVESTWFRYSVWTARGRTVDSSDDGWLLHVFAGSAAINLASPSNLHVNLAPMT